ncbi:fasciclin domain-containing protein [Acidobacteriota bacterium]
MQTVGTRVRSWILALTVISLMGAGAMGTAWAGPTQDICDTVKGLGSCKTFVKAMKNAGLDEKLKSKGPITIFVPTDEAFAKLYDGGLDELLKPENKAELRKVLSHHVAKGKLTKKHMLRMDWVQTLDGKKVFVRHKKGDLRFGKKANIIKTDIAWDNGVIHIIDKVVTP